MDLVFWDPSVAKRYCSRNSSKVRQCWLDRVLSRVHENQSVQLGAFSAMGVCHGEIP